MRSWPTGPEQPEVEADQVDVWLVDLDAEGGATADRLPRRERERAASFHREETARRWATSRWALRRVLGPYLGEASEAIRIEVGDHGKPRLEDGGLEFNLSHSGGLALVAVSRGREVGVDVERIDPQRDVLTLAERALEPDAVEEVRDSIPERRAVVFHAAWTRHEAWLKCLGAGLSGRREDEPVVIRKLDVPLPYAAAVAVRGTEFGRLRCWTLPPG